MEQSYHSICVGGRPSLTGWFGSLISTISDGVIEVAFGVKTRTNMCATMRDWSKYLSGKYHSIIVSVIGTAIHESFVLVTRR